MAHNIGIIGAGLAGTAVLAHLVEALPKGSEITIFEESGNFGPGSPYHPDLPPYFLLNHEADHMGGLGVPPQVEVKKSENDDFFHWVCSNRERLITRYVKKWGTEYPEFINQLKQDIDSGNKDAFLPRSLYGMYLAECFEAHCKKAALKNITVLPIHTKATHVDEHSITCKDKNGVISTFPVTAAALCLGHWQGSALKEFENNPYYFTSPYQQQFYNQQKKTLAQKTVLVQGTGLSAIDATFMALESGKATKVIMASRHGKLREIRHKFAPYERKYLTIENLESLAIKAGTGINEYGEQLIRLEDALSLGRQEFEAAQESTIDWQEVLTPSSALSDLEKTLADHDANKISMWRSVLASLGAGKGEIYRRLPPEDQQVFLQLYHSSLLAYTAPMPAITARRLIEYMKAGRLEVRGGINSLSYDKENEKFVARFLYDESGRPLVHQEHLEATPSDVTEELIEADVVISSVGQDRDVRKIPLIKNMIEVGIASQHHSGGLNIDTKTGRILSPKDSAVSQENLFATGPVTIGARLSINSIAAVSHAKTVSAQIAGYIQSKPKARSASFNSF